MFPLVYFSLVPLASFPSQNILSVFVPWAFGFPVLSAWNTLLPAVCVACSLLLGLCSVRPSLTTLSQDTHLHPSLSYSALFFFSHRLSYALFFFSHHSVNYAFSFFSRHLIHYPSTLSPSVNTSHLYERGRGEPTFLSVRGEAEKKSQNTLSSLISHSPWLSSVTFHNLAMSHRSWRWRFHRCWTDLISSTESVVDISGTLFRM